MQIAQSQIANGDFDAITDSHLQLAVVAEAACLSAGMMAAAAVVDRLLGDARLLDDLMLRGYTGREWERFRRALAEYALQVIRAWCLTGKIRQLCARKGFGQLPAAPRRLQRDDADEIAADTVALALNHFREHVLIPRRWDPSKGASLRTFFVGSCIYSYSNAYARWCRENRATPRDAEAELQPAQGNQVAAMMLKAVLREMEELAPLDGDVVDLAAEGWGQKEIAERFSTTPKSIEMRLRRARQRLAAVL
jgi:DNA-directed RNA polymerase specialized sigma24 family protein